jgi:hypothetical protein
MGVAVPGRRNARVLTFYSPFGLHAKAPRKSLRVVISEGFVRRFSSHFGRERPNFRVRSG